MILVSGCSFTSKYDNDLDPKCYDHKKWPDFLGEFLNREIKNVALPGRGPEYIFNSIIDKILIEDKKYEMVIAAWTTGNRIDIPLTGNQNRSMIIRPDSNLINLMAGKSNSKYDWSNKALRYPLLLDLMCKFLDIPLIQFQLGPFYGDFTRLVNWPTIPWEKFIEKNRIENNSKYKKILELESFINDPLKDVYSDLDMSKYVYEPNDVHYNEDGHLKVAEWLLKEMVKKYDL